MDTIQRRRTLKFVVFVVLLLFLSLGCNLTNILFPATETLGQSGGKMSGAGGVQLDVPQGALLEDVKFSIIEESNPPSAPESLKAISPAYTIEIENNPALVKPVKLTIPIKRDETLPEDSYAIYRWSGSEWEMVGGAIDGDTISVDVLQFSTYQAKACSKSEYRPVLFVDQSPKAYPDFRYSGITPWDATLEDDSCGGQIRRLYSAVNMSGTNGDITWGSQVFPWGEYRRWCVVWSEADPNSNLMLRYHMYVNQTIVLDENSCTVGDWRSGKCVPDSVVYTLPGFGGGIKGGCGEDQGQTGIIGTATQTGTISTPASTTTLTSAKTQPPTQTISPAYTPTLVTNSLTFRTYIDGQSQVILHGKAIYFYHLLYAAPGAGYARPNYVNGVEWYPTWPAPAPDYNRDCNCYSSEYTDIAPLARLDQTVNLTVIESRDADQIQIIQQPNASNDYTFIIEIYDYSPGGGWYEFTLTYLSSE